MVRVLLIDDDRIEHTLVHAHLRTRYGDDFSLDCVFDVDAAKAALEQSVYDIVLLDNRLHPHKSYLQVVHAVSDRLNGARLYVISASIEDLPCPIPDGSLVRDYIDKYHLRSKIIEGQLG